MTVHTTIVPCVDTLTRRLLADMANIWRSVIYTTNDERLNALQANYKFNQFVKGSFIPEEDVLIFRGEVATCKTEVRVPR
jgi:hypothetical protein